MKSRYDGPMSEHFKVVSIGGGPAGIALAIECVEMGLKPAEILVLEKGNAPIDAIRKFYPDKKMTLANYKGLPAITEGHLGVFSDLTKTETLEYFDALIKKYALNLRLNSEVSKITQRGSRYEILVGHEILTADFVGIGIGILGRPNKPTYKLLGSLRQHLLFDLTSQKVQGQKVLVVGGGDTSCEYCQALIEEGNQVTLAYRRETFSRMMTENSASIARLELAGRLEIRLGCSVKEIQDQGGKPLVIFEDEQKFPAQTFDKVIYSIGGTTPVNFLKTIGIEFQGDWPKLGENGETNLPGLYLIGDLVAGKLGGSIITAYNSAYRSAKDIVSKIRL
jgi:thioredoxin reductase (NADPH)